MSVYVNIILLYSIHELLMIVSPVCDVVSAINQRQEVVYNK